MSTPSPENGRPKTIFTHNKFKLSAKPLPDAKPNTYTKKPQAPTLEIVPVNNEWHFKVYTNSQSDTKANGIITGAMDGPTLYAVFAALSRVSQCAFDSVLAGKDKVEGLDAVVIDNRGFSFQGGRRSENAHTLSKTHIGIDENGVYISVRSSGRPEINFNICSGEYHNIIGRVNGQKAESPLFETAIYGLGMATAYLNIAATINKDHFISWQQIKAAKEQNRNNGGHNGGNRNGYSGGSQQGGYQKPQQQQQSDFGGGNAGGGLFDDDIPM